MGYELYITRQNDWFEKDQLFEISLEEWINYVKNDPEMRLDGFAQIEVQNGEILRIDNEGISVWIKYSGEGIGQNHAWFSYYHGNIIVKNPNQEIINKMCDIASTLNAKVQGDNGELYEKAPFLNRRLEEINDTWTIQKKPWWKIW